MHFVWANILVQEFSFSGVDISTEDTEAKALVKSLEGKLEFESKFWPPRQKDYISCGMYTVYNIALAGLSINLTPSL